MRTVLLVLALVVWGCGAEPPSHGSTTAADAIVSEPVATWKRIASWSGRGDGQTTTFLMERHVWRLNWEARGGVGEEGARFTVRVHSADSGRILDVPVESVQKGAGSVEMAEEPRVFYLSVEAGDLEWSLSVDERIERLLPRQER